MSFAAVKIEELRREGDVTMVASDATLLEAYQTLVEKDIYSVPVYDSSQQKKYLGLFDLVDMIAEMVHMIMSHGNAKTVEELQTVVSSKLKKEVPGVIETLFSERVIDAMDKSGQNPFRPLPEGTPLSEVIEHLTTETRRIPILSEDGKIVQMVSQSDIVRYIHSTPTHMQSLRDKLSQPILAVTRKAVSVCPTVRVVDCFATMIEARVSALPVVDDDVNALVGVVTLKDISGIFEDNKQLFTPIEDYIAWMRQKNTGTLREFPFISMQATDTLEKALNKMMVAKIHRVFVKQSGQTGVFVLTLKDILHALL